MSVLERCSSYKESNKGTKQRQGPTLGVRFTEVSVKSESTVMHLKNKNKKNIYACKLELNIKLLTNIKF